MKNLIVGVFIMIAVPAVFAGSIANLDKLLKKIEKTQQVCLGSEEGMSTLGIVGCFRQSLDSYDGLMNIEYSKIVKDFKKSTGDNAQDKSNKEQLSLLILSQRDWVKFRDTNSAFSMISNYGGSASQIDYISTQSSMTKNRLVEIMNIVYGFEGR